MGELLVVAADGSQSDRLVGLQVGEPVVQQVVERRRCRSTSAIVWIAWTVGGHVVAVALEGLVECGSGRGLGGVATQVVEAALAVAVGRGALDAGVPPHA